MAFGFTKTSGDFLPIVKYDSRDGRLTRRDSVAGAQGFEKTETDITDNFSAVMDLENIQVGWILFPPNEAPKKVLSVYLKEPMPGRPAPEYKQGFNLIMALGKDCGGGIYEMTGNSNMLVEAIGALHDEYTEGVASDENRGKLPVVTFEGARKEETKFGKFYRPKFAIERWVDRPEKLKRPTPGIIELETPPKNGAAKPFSSAPSTGSTVKSPPPKAAKAPAEATADDFG